MSSIKTENCIAIDFGTSNTAVMVYKNGICQNPVYTVENYYCIPSVAVIDKDGIVVPDHLSSLSNSKGYIFNVKRILGKVKSQFKDSEIKEEMFHAPIKFDEHENPYFEVSYGLGKNKGSRNVYPIEVVTAILKKCKSEAEKLLDSHVEVRDCVMTIPNYFFDTSKIALQEAAKKAGLNVLYFVKEPTAAGIRYITGDEEIKEGETVLVFDFGGGTLDLTIMVRNGNRFEVKAQGGDPNLGGNKIDELFCDYVLQKYKNEYGEDLLGTDITSKKYKRQYSDLLLSCRQLKELLSSSHAADMSLSDLSENIECITVTQDDFNIMILEEGGILRRVDNAMSDLFSKTDIDTKGISYVILVGGSSKIPYIQEHLKKYFNSIPVSIMLKYNPHTTVAEGAMMVKVNNMYQEVSESLECCLGFKVMDDRSSSELQIDLHPGLKIPIFVTRYFNLSGNDIDVYRSFNGKERIEGTILVKQALEEFGQTMIKVKITCEKDTSVEYIVLSEFGREIGRINIQPKVQKTVA